MGSGFWAAEFLLSVELQQQKNWLKIRLSFLSFKNV